MNKLRIIGSLLANWFKKKLIKYVPFATAKCKKGQQLGLNVANISFVTAASTIGLSQERTSVLYANKNLAQFPLLTLKEKNR